MTALFDTLALLVTLAALVAVVVVLMATRDLSAAFAVFLDLLTAAGLLRLAAAPGYRRVLTAAAILLIRRLVKVGLQQDLRRR